MLRPNVDQRKSEILEAAVQVTDPAPAAARLSALRDGLAIQQTLFGGGQLPDVFVDEFRGGICHELGLSRAEYDRLLAITE